MLCVHTDRHAGFRLYSCCTNSWPWSTLSMLCVNSHRLVSKTLLFLYELRVVKHSTNALCTYILLLLYKLYKLRAVKHTTNCTNLGLWSTLQTVQTQGCEAHYKLQQCLAGTWKRRLSCHAGCQEVSRYHPRGESQGTCNITHMPPLSSNKAEPTLALKPRGDITRSPKQGYEWPHKKGMSSKI